MYSYFNYIFALVPYGNQEMNEFVDKFNRIKTEHPFYISYFGMAPSVLNYGPTHRVIFIKHKEDLLNTTAGLKESLHQLIHECGIEHKVRLLNS